MMLRDRFIEYPETVAGDASPAFIEFASRVHPSQPYDSATAALMARQAYDLGRREVAAQMLDTFNLLVALGWKPH